MRRVLLLTSHRPDTTVSYYLDWAEAFCEHPSLDVDVLDTQTSRRRLALELFKRRRRTYDLIVFPYGFYPRNTDTWRRALFQTLADKAAKKVFFLENEYRLLNKKLAYATVLDADYVTTQLPKDVADRIYAPFLDPARIVALPHALNPKAAAGVNHEKARPIDLTFRGDVYPAYLGHQERQLLASFFEQNAERWGLTIETNLGRGQRLERSGWLNCLAQAAGVLHHESGSDYLETNDVRRAAANALEDGGASLEEIQAKVFADCADPISGRCISSRHFDAIATRTCQIMFRGRYNDLLVADEHYLALEKDFSNADDVIARFKDPAHRDAIVHRAYEHALSAHTHRHRIDHLLQRVGL